MARMHGSHGSVAIADASPEVVIASLNSWSLNMARDRVDVTSFGDANKTYVQGLMDISGDLGGFYDPGDGSPGGSPQTGGNTSLFDAAEGDTPVTLKLVPTTLDPFRYWSGLAYIDASITVTASGAVTLSGSFVAAGPWTHTE